jgi:hypothetical protein
LEARGTGEQTETTRKKGNEFLRATNHQASNAKLMQLCVLVGQKKEQS